MTFVYATTPGRIQPSRRVVRAPEVWPVALATVGLVAWTTAFVTSLVMPLQSATVATALLIAALAERALPYEPQPQRRHPARGIDGTHNAGGVLVPSDRLFGTCLRVAVGSPAACHR